MTLTDLLQLACSLELTEKHVFSHYDLGETAVDLHCDNCSGQNKNRFMLNYLIWRVMRGLHTEITINFMPPGHTKFAPDWCFGLLKEKILKGGSPLSG